MFRLEREGPKVDRLVVNDQRAAGDRSALDAQVFAQSDRGKALKLAVS